MIVIFEGCDCVGKTSLIKEFTKLLGEDTCIVKHFAAPPKVLTDTKQQHEWNRLDYLHEVDFMEQFGNDINLIYDRYALGEAVYAPRYRNYYPNYITNLLHVISRRNAILVLVTCSYDVAKARFDGKGMDAGDIEKVIDVFDFMFDMAPIERKIKIDTSSKKQDVLARELLETMEKKGWTSKNI